MSAFINMAMLSTTVFKSDVLGVLASIIHPLPVGEYEGEALRGKAVVGHFTISIVNDAEPSSVQINLDSFAGPQSSGATLKYRATGTDKDPGFVLFYVSKGEGGFHVVLRGGDKVVFDSRRLDEGDMYAVTLVRPGAYEMTAGKSLRGSIEVTPVSAKTQPRGESEAARVTVRANGLQPNKVSIQAGDSVVFALQTAAVISVSFEDKDKDKGPGKRPQRPIRVLGPDHLDIERRTGTKASRARGRRSKG